MACRPTDELFLREAGIFHFKSGDFDIAGPALEQAIRSRPDDLFALFYYANLLSEQGQPRKALPYYERIVQRLPRDAEVRQYYGRSLGQAGDLFAAHLNLAYAALYGSERRKIRFHVDEAERLARTPEQKQEFKELKKTLDKYEDQWKKM